MISEKQMRGNPNRMPLAYIRHIDNTWDDFQGPHFINGRCLDISKNRVDEVFEAVFGYGTRLDPSAFVGEAVMKSDVNCDGVGILVQCPISKKDIRPGFIYQKLVDNVVADGVVEEYRVAIIGGRIADVHVVRRSAERRLKGRGGGGSLGSVCRTAADVFTATEIDCIEEFCQRLGLELGELDVIPDFTDGRNYILDANKTATIMTSARAVDWQRFAMLSRRAALFEQWLRRGDYQPPTPKS